MTIGGDMRKGIFKVTEGFIDDAPEVVRQVMGKVIVVRAECFYGGIVEYLALSPEFDKLKTGEIVPEYKVNISSKKMGIKTVVDKIVFERVK